MHGKIIVSGVGCCLVDMLYNNINFSGEAIRPFFSKMRGDGGLTPGKLVFQEDFERYSSVKVDTLVTLLTGGREYDKINIGGPSIVSLINAAQLTDRENCEVRFYGRAGIDANGHYLVSAINKTPVVLKDYQLVDNRTPSTIVLSDPAWDKGHGERMFINSIGAAWDYRPDELDGSFFESDIVVFGGTALVPNIHDNLAYLLNRAKSEGCITIVNTVFDFRNEMANPSRRWPLGESDDSYSNTDLLITDREEALRLSGESTADRAVKFLIAKGTRAFIITNGAEDIIAYSDGSFLTSSSVKRMPVSRAIRNELKNFSGGDTTGCGDNFVGGVIASVVNQLNKDVKNPDFTEVCSWGIASGGYTCFYIGGTYFEELPGEKLNRIKPYYELYKRQISGQ